MRRINDYGEHALHFNLMALTRDRIEMYEEQQKEVNDRLISLSGQNEKENSTLQHKLLELKEDLVNERRKREGWEVNKFGFAFHRRLTCWEKRESRLRKHNFIPLIYNILRLSAEHGQLDKLVSQGKEKAQRKRKGDQSEGIH